jgi:Protein of unknown function (DUF3667)
VSHLKERKEKNCLNCQSEVVGRFCHKCGQENLEPKETVWHLVQHFFNDITHFDGKFFETVKYLLRRPGFLSLEYMRGRRMAYLNPIRMYVFTSAIFFIILFSMKKPEDMAKASDYTHDDVKVAMNLGALRQDSARLAKNLKAEDDADDREDLKEKIEFRAIEIAAIKKTYGDTVKRVFSKNELAGFVTQAYSDSIASGNYNLAKQNKFKRAMREYGKEVSDNVNVNVYENDEIFGWGIKYRTVAEYDSAEKALPESLRDGWLKRLIIRRSMVITKEYREDRRLFIEHLLDNIFHSFPKILWISLPIFALILNILYFRHKHYYYVNHGIFTIHVYCATFIQIFVFLMIYQLGKAVPSGGWHTIVILLNLAVFIWMMIYPYKAMRGFYMQRRAKTFIKYFILFSLMSLINLMLLVIFLLISVFTV